MQYRSAKLLFVVTCALIAGLLAACGPAASTPTPSVEPTAIVEIQPSPMSCDGLVAAALERADSFCTSLGRNQACYGSSLVNAQLAEGSNEEFGSVGDVADLSAIRSLTTAALDVEQQVWGIAFLKVQANLPDTLPGQNVTFLLYGGATLENVTPQMNAVVLKTDVASTSCASAPAAALLIQSPDGTRATLSINGADIALGSTAYVTAAQNQEMRIATIEGAADVTANNVTRRVEPGAQIRVTLGGANGLEAVSAPSEPEPYDLQAAQQAPLPLLDRPVTAPLPIPTLVPATPTFTLQPTSASADPNLRADQSSVRGGECTTIRWDASNTQRIFFEGQPVANSGSQQVCPTASKTYTLLITYSDGRQVSYAVRIEVAG
ncbi:MAG: hypothetical protein JNM70_15115 [Anaerolineae bacterium]|nr:hypothetical protein [Anaerolineae bacterium]